jgi:predicted branched-subunit amino acid permease
VTANDEPASVDPWTRYAVIAGWAFVALGIVARLLRYLLAFPLWHDECMLADNFLSRSYAGLLDPLDHCQVAPLGFLWAELTSTRLFGFNEYSLRLPALVGGIGALLVVHRLATRWLSPLSGLLATALCACSYYPIRHSAEVKPYSTDMFFSAALLALAIAWWREPTRLRRLWALVGLAPVAIASSFPAVFVAGGIGLGMFAAACKSRRRVTWFAVLAYGLSIAVAFGLVYRLSSAAQEARSGAQMREFWKESFPPPASEPWNWLGWMASTHTGEMFAYPVGSDHGGSIITSLLVVVGIVALARRRAYVPLAMIGGTFALAYVAAALHRYPYSNNSRMVLYLGPIVILLAAEGAARLLSRPPTRWVVVARWATVVLLSMFPVGMMLRDLTHPYKHSQDWQHCGFARWFWRHQTDHAQLMCLGEGLEHDLWGDADRSQFRCYRQIYAPRQALAADPTQVPGNEDVLCVMFVPYGQSPDAASFDRWMSAMSERYRLAEHEAFPVDLERHDHPIPSSTYELYRFVPKANIELGRLPNTTTLR